MQLKQKTFVRLCLPNVVYEVNFSIGKAHYTDDLMKVVCLGREPGAISYVRMLMF